MKVSIHTLVVAGALMLGATAAAPLAAADGVGSRTSVDAYRGYCQDEAYRERYWGYCRRFYEGRDGEADAYGNDAYDDDAYDDDAYDDGDYGAYYGDYYGFGYGDYYGYGDFYGDFDRGHRQRDHHGDHHSDHHGDHHGSYGGSGKSYHSDHRGR